MWGWLLAGIIGGTVFGSFVCLVLHLLRGGRSVVESTVAARIDMLNAFPEPVALSEKGRIVFRNTAWNREMAYAPLAENWDDWCAQVAPYDFRTALCPAMAVEQGSVRAMRNVRTDDNRVLEWTAVPFQGMGRRLILNILRDVTDVLEEGYDEAVFLDKAAHELKTPVTAIKGYAELLAIYTRSGRPLPDQVADRIVSQTDRLVHLVNQILDVGRMSAGRLKNNPEPVSLKEHLEAVVDRIRSTFPEREIRLEVDPVATVIDPDRLEQVVRDLAYNALQFSEPDQPVDISLRLRVRTLELAVTDRGTGIDAADLPRLFERFYRGKNAAGRATAQGFGLGLFLVQSIVRRWRGEIDVDSEVGRGTTVRVRWPWRAPLPTHEKVQASRAAAPEAHHPR